MDKIGSKNCGSGREILGYIRGVANQERCGDNSDWHTCRYIYIYVELQNGRRDRQ